jgi:hypothetical protein
LVRMMGSHSLDESEEMVTLKETLRIANYYVGKRYLFFLIYLWG